jgi:nucleoside-diphosphate-sugar epimerase
VKGIVIGCYGSIGKYLCNYKGFQGIDRLSENDCYQADVVVNCGAKIHAGDDELQYANVDCAENYLKIALKNNPKVRYIHLGSSSEYGNHNGRFKESDVCLPTTPYAVSKLKGTNKVLQLAKENPDAKINVVRPFSVYSEFDKPFKFIPTIINNVINGNESVIHNGFHDWIDVEDVAKIVITLAKSNFSGEIFNAGTGVSISNNEMFGYVRHAALGYSKGIEAKYKIVPTAYRDYDREQWESDTSKVSSLLGFKDYINPLDGIGYLYGRLHRLARRSWITEQGTKPN